MAERQNMRAWLDTQLRSKVKRAMPVLSFPAVQLMGISVRELISDSDAQARGMKLVAERTDAAASVSLMDLSVEAECFGSTIRVSDDEVPTVIGAVVHDEDEARSLEVPKVGAARSGLYVDAMRKAVGLISDRPVFAGVIGPFSLAARLLDVTEIMVDCYDEPDMVHIVLDKAAKFLTEYCLAYKAVGANGVVVAEPVAGLQSPALAEEFATPYIKRIIDAVQDDEFIVIYHNCGNAVPNLLDTIYSIGASAYHFGNAVDLSDILSRTPDDIIVMGNIDPASQFRQGTPESMREAVLGLLKKCAPDHPNFIISSGCDIPPLSKWENIDAFFAAVREYYGSC